MFSNAHSELKPRSAGKVRAVAKLTALSVMLAGVVACEAKNHSFLLPDWGDAAAPTSQRSPSRDASSSAVSSISTTAQTNSASASGAVSGTASSGLGGATSDAITANTSTNDTDMVGDSTTRASSAPASTAVGLDGGTPSLALMDGAVTAAAETSTNQPASHSLDADAGIGSPDAAVETTFDSSQPDAATLEFDASIDASQNEGAMDAAPAAS